VLDDGATSGEKPRKSSYDSGGILNSSLEHRIEAIGAMFYDISLG
jgi:hypothetical protein